MVVISVKFIGRELRDDTHTRRGREGTNSALFNKRWSFPAINFLDLLHLNCLYTYVVCHSAKLEYCISMVGLVPELLTIGEYNLTVVLMNCMY